MILLIQNNSSYRQHIRQSLEEIDLCVKQINSTSELEFAMRSVEITLIIMDVVAGSRSGFDLCREIVSQPKHPAVIFISSSNSPADRVLGLELGAEDFIAYPCHARELQARVRVQLKHQPNHGSSDNISHLVQRGPLMIDSKQHAVTVNGVSIELTHTEFNLLHFFASHPNQVFSRAQLLDTVWGYQHDGYDHTVNSHINRLRAKLHRAAPATDFIKTIWGVGYQFKYEQLKVKTNSPELMLVSN